MTGYTKNCIYNLMRTCHTSKTAYYISIKRSPDTSQTALKIINKKMFLGGEKRNEY